MTSKGFKLWLYKNLARCRPGVLLFVLIVTFAIVLFLLITGVPLRPGTAMILNILFFVSAVIFVLLFLSGIFIWLWYFVWFRYVAYGVAWVISLFRRLLKNSFFQFIIILAASFLLWWGRKVSILSMINKEYNIREMLIFSQAIKIFLIAVLLYALWKIKSARKRIFISEFKNYTGDEKLEPAVKGVAARILNEANRLSKLIKTIDRIQPEFSSKEGVSTPPVNVQEMGKGIDEIMGRESSVEIGKLKIPLKSIYAFFYRLMHGPILSGGVHLKGEKLVITACLKGGKYSGSWEINIDDIEKPPPSRFGQVIAMTNQLVCRIIAEISQGGSPRWKAMNHYTRALSHYRETLLKREKKKLNLIKAKNEFSRALKDDSKFVWCYYNLGIIYDELKSNHAAIAAFRKALESAPDNYRCYYQLARLYYKENNYFDGRWFCEQALRICPTEADHWNLWAVIQFKKNYDVGKDDYKKRVDIPDEVFHEVALYLMNASALAWRALCKSIINGEKVLQFKNTASICIRNLAVSTGMRKYWRSRCRFNQAIFLEPDNNDLYFESGGYYYRYYSDYRKKRIIKAYEAFKRVFEDDKEVDDPFSFWAYYMNVNAQLYATKGDRKYKEIVDEGFFYFLDAASEIIQNKKEKPEDIEIHEEQVSDALSTIKKKDAELGLKEALLIIKKIKKILNSSESSLNKKKDEKPGTKEALHIIRKAKENLSSAESSLKEKKNDVRSSVESLKKKNKGFLIELIEILNGFKPFTSEDDDENAYKQIDEYLNNLSENFSQDGNGFSFLFNKWVEGQAVKLAILNLEEIKKGTNKDSKNQAKKKDFLKREKMLLISSINAFEEKNLKVIKRLGLKRYLAEAYYKSREYDEALKIAREAVRLDPYNWEVRELLGRIYFALNDYQQAVKEFEISARIEELPNAKLIEILKEIGKAYEENGNIMRIPEQRKNAFKKAVEFFTDALEMLEDKSYENNDEEKDNQYIDVLAGIHFYLGTFYYELLDYDNAITHFKIARKMGYEILQTLMKIGWTYFECEDFNEAEQTFKEAESEVKKFNEKEQDEKTSGMISVEIKLGIAFSLVERFITLNDEILTGESLKVLKDVNKSQEIKNLIDNVKNTDEKSRLSALYHECLARFYFKQEKIEDAEKEFEKSLSYQANPRVYYYLAQLYWEKTEEGGDSLNNLYLGKTRSAFLLCLKNDLQGKYKNEVSELLEKLSAFEKQPKETKNSK
jgi:tetratricopeptide (TPR) repeat protein